VQEGVTRLVRSVYGRAKATMESKDGADGFDHDLAFGPRTSFDLCSTLLYYDLPTP
jgi:hypothetical protein